MQSLIYNFFNLELMWLALPFLLRGFGMTLLLCAIVVPMGCFGGLMVALLSGLPTRWVRWPMLAYVDFFRAFPPLVLLILIYAGAPFAGINVPAFVAVVLGFFLNTSAYYGEILRAGIESVGYGQMEAARSTGLTRLQAMFYVIVPQAVRNVLPDLISNTLEVVKFTALASVVALPELLYAANMVRAITFSPSPVVAAAAIYLAMLWPIVRLIARLEHRVGMARH